jgi:hypothetical protein
MKKIELELNYFAWNILKCMSIKFVQIKPLGVKIGHTLKVIDLFSIIRRIFKLMQSPICLRQRPCGQGGISITTEGNGWKLHTLVLCEYLTWLAQVP